MRIVTVKKIKIKLFYKKNCISAYFCKKIAKYIISIQVIKILQRRNEEEIVICISEIASNGTDKVVEAALIALGTIGTEQSSLALATLCRELPDKAQRGIAKKQLSHQYINP